MAYITYFEGINNIPPNYTPISIGYEKGLWIRHRGSKRAIPPTVKLTKLIPTASIINEFNETHNEDVFKKRYKEEILSALDPASTVSELLALSCNFKGVDYYPSFILCCDKKYGIYYTNLIEQWFNDAGYNIPYIDI